MARIINLFTPLKIKDVELKNRIVMAPMCMYSSDDSGVVKDFHVAHYGARALGGASLIIMEATAVTKNGRITENDLGLWSDEQVEPMKALVKQCHGFGAKMAVQIGHAGRKCEIPTENIVAPSPIAFNEKYQKPSEISISEIKKVIESFAQAARRADASGFDVIEIHGAHGYLISQFLSPLTNKRTDEYGGSHENRVRLLREVIVEVRKYWKKAIIVRISAGDMYEGGNTKEDLAKMINIIKSEGVDALNVSSGGVVPNATMKVFPGYQIYLSEFMRNETKLPVIGGGLITQAQLAENIIGDERADAVFIGRALLRDPNWALNAAKELGANVTPPVQYTMAF